MNSSCDSAFYVVSSITGDLVQADLTEPVSSISFSRLDRNPSVCGGDVCIKGSRVPVWVLVQFYKLGVDRKDILSAFPTLKDADLEDALNYYQHNWREIDQQIADNESA